MKKFLFITCAVMIVSSCNHKISNEEVLVLRTLQGAVLQEYFKGQETISMTEEIISDKTSGKAKTRKAESTLNQLNKFDSLVAPVLLYLYTQRVEGISDKAAKSYCPIQTVNFRKVMDEKDGPTNDQITELFKRINQFKRASSTFIDSLPLYQKEYLKKEILVRINLIENLNQDNYISSPSTWQENEQTILSVLKQVLECRTILLQNIFNEIGIGNYPFSHIETVVRGSKNGKIGDTLTFQVFTAAIDKYNNPVISNIKNAQLVEVKNGMAQIQFIPVEKGIHIISGEITYKNKSGVKKTSPWRDTIEIIN